MYFKSLLQNNDMFGTYCNINSFKYKYLTQVMIDFGKPFLPSSDSRWKK